ncbi:HSP20 family protein [Geobacter sp. DSM 9736]|nr:HSP20 family protein [Geobacter sp. DSM 9736]
MALSPFHEMERMERMFDEFFKHPFSLLTRTPWSRSFSEFEQVHAPHVDVFEEGNSVVVKAEVPGISKEEIDVTFKENVLTISGEKKKEEKVENKDYYQLERSYGSFSRSIFLPTEVKTEEASATFKDGVLEIRIPRTEESKEKVKKITIH